MEKFPEINSESTDQALQSTEALEQEIESEASVEIDIEKFIKLEEEMLLKHPGKAADVYSVVTELVSNREN